MKNLYVLFFLFFPLIGLEAKEPSQERLPMFVFFTESHRILFDDWFLPTLPDEFDLTVYEVEQTCPTAVFRTTGWKETVQKKIEITLEMIDSFWGELFVYSDVDIQFFRPIKEEILQIMQGKDFMIQLSRPSGWCCSGFYVVRANERTKKLFHDALNIMKDGKAPSDEPAINKALISNKKLKWSHFPESYFCAGTLTGKMWRPGQELRLPKNIALHHANYVKGVENKILQLEHVREKVASGAKK